VCGLPQGASNIGGAVVNTPITDGVYGARQNLEETGVQIEVLDHSLNLSGGVDERDAGFGIERLPDGSIVQREPAAEERDDEVRDRNT